MNYENPNNETELLTADEQKLREMCRTLKRAEAPQDFDFKLKARIANAKAGDFEPRRRFVPAMRYALPALALILVLGLLAYNGGFLSVGNNSIVIGGATEPQNPTQPQNSAVSSFAPLDQAANDNTAVLPLTQDSPKSAEVAARQLKKVEVEVKRRPKENEAGGSTLQSLTNSRTILPKFSIPPSVPQNSQDSEAPNPIPVSEVLSQMGISADFENGKWSVRSVTSNSLGESSGVKPNDVIEAIDDQPVSGTTVFGKTLKGNTITVTRNGQKALIKLRNKQ